MSWVRSIAYGCVLGLLACDTLQTPPAGDNPGDLPEVYAFLSPSDHLLRASMAIRGIRPTPEQILAVEENPDLLPDFVDSYLADPILGDMVRDLGTAPSLLA